VGLWDVRIFVATSFAVARQRAMARDAALLGGAEATARMYEERYQAACRDYLQAADPESHASHVIRNDDPARPSLIRK
jgi:uridine kinase